MQPSCPPAPSNSARGLHGLRVSFWAVNRKIQTTSSKKKTITRRRNVQPPTPGTDFLPGSVTHSSPLFTFWGMRGKRGNKTGWDTGRHWLSHPLFCSRSAAAGCYPGWHWEFDRTKPVLNKHVASHYESELRPARGKGATCQVLAKIFLLLVPFTYSSQAANARPNRNYS